MTHDDLRDAGLRHPIQSLDSQGATFAWAEHQSLQLNDRYRSRQLPLIRESPRPPVGDHDLSPGEFWPPVRSLVLALPDEIMADPVLAQFIEELRASAAADAVWFEGLAARAGRLHATVASGVSEALTTSDNAEGSSDGSSVGVEVVVHGPWVGHWNSGRIYLPVSAADDRSEALIRGARAWCGGGSGALLAGFLQLRRDVSGDGYLQLQRLVQSFQTRVSIKVRVAHLTAMETMDDLVLRSRVLGRRSFLETVDGGR